MVVVIIIAIVAVLAIPSMHLADIDRRAYADAGYIAQIVREAKMRAIGRGGAVYLTLSTTPSTNSGAFEVFDMVAPNPTGTGTDEVPVASCSGAGASGTNFVEQFIFGSSNASLSTVEKEANIVAKVYDPTGTLVSSGATLTLCFTPGGRTFYSMAPPTFTALPLSVSVVVEREDSSGTPIGISRTVVIPSTGAARIVSQ